MTDGAAMMAEDHAIGQAIAEVHTPDLNAQPITSTSIRSNSPLSILEVSPPPSPLPPTTRRTKIPKPKRRRVKSEPPDEDHLDTSPPEEAILTPRGFGEVTTPINNTDIKECNFHENIY